MSALIDNIEETAPALNTLEAMKEAALAAARIGSQERKKDTKNVTRQDLQDAIQQGAPTQFLVAKKLDGSLVTSGNMLAQREIAARLGAIDGQAVFIGEESPQMDVLKTLAENRCWVVDPIDGTRNYATKGEHWAISIALQDKGVSQRAAVYVAENLDHGMLYWAEKGKGAYRQAVKGNALHGEPEQIISKQQAKFPLKLTLDENVRIGTFLGDPQKSPGGKDARGWSRKNVTNILREALGKRQVKASDKGSVEPVLVSCACADALATLNGDFYAHGKHYPWDDAAVSLILAEAGVPLAKRRASREMASGVLIAGPNQMLVEAVDSRLQAIERSRPYSAPER